jgi:hypothetical protein
LRVWNFERPALLLALSRTSNLWSLAAFHCVIGCELSVS